MSILQNTNQTYVTRQHYEFIRASETTIRPSMIRTNWKKTIIKTFLVIMENMSSRHSGIFFQQIVTQSCNKWQFMVDTTPKQFLEFLCW